MLISVLLAGIRRNSGLILDTSTLATGEIRSLLDRYLNVGEYFYDKLLSYLQLSRYFKVISFGDNLRRRAYDYVKKQVAEMD